MSHRDIVAHYEDCLRRHGDNHRGVDWPDAAGAQTRYRVMLDLVRPGADKATLLDFGCGASHLYEHLASSGREGLEYSGLDLSPDFIALCRRKHPGVPYYCLDVLADGRELPEFDYVVANGVFTEKCSLEFGAMLRYFQEAIKAVFAKTRVGLAFNVMSKHVDWERDDLFHLPFDTLAAFLREEVSRHFVFRNDYGLYEYTTYVYRHG